jgi:hypothetical protein
MSPYEIDLASVGYLLLALLGVGLCLALLLLGLVFWRVRKIHLPADADFLTALQATPFLVVVVLDLLDFSLDFLSAPISWLLLRRLGLGPLQGVTLLEEFIPGTQVIPTMTIAWLVARIFRPRCIEPFDGSGFQTIDISKER